MSTKSDIEKGDTVVFLGLRSILYASDGNELYAGLVRRNKYTVKESFIVGIHLEEVEGMFLKEHFRKINNDKD